MATIMEFEGKRVSAYLALGGGSMLLENRRLGLVMAILVALSVFSFADTITTSVSFNVPSSITFTLTLPGQSPAASGGSPSAAIEYNATGQNGPNWKKINCTVAVGGGASQTALVPCFNYTNTGNRALNITLAFDAVPTGVAVKAGLNNSAWTTTCGCVDLISCVTDDCVNVTTSAVKVANIAYASYKDVWMWADYTSYMGGSTNTQTLTHTSQID